MTSEEKSINNNGVINQEELSNTSAREGQVAGKIHILAQKDDIASKDVVSQSYCNPEAKQAINIVFFYLLLPIVLVAFYFVGIDWFHIYQTNNVVPYTIDAFDHYFLLSLCIFWAIVYITPLYVLLILWRICHGKPWDKIDKIIFSIVISSIWSYSLVYFLRVRYFLEQLLNIYFNNIELLVYIGIILLLVIIMLKACYAILGYNKSKHTSIIDLIFCIALSITYVTICNLVSEKIGIRILSL